MKKNIQKQLSGLPDKFGVYIFKSYQNEVLYIGKACCLKKRVSSYFQNSISSKKMRNLVKQIYSIDYVITSNEAEALLVENRLIKKEKPKYNIMYRDDKSYPLVEITNDKFPRIQTTRNKNKESLFLGPFTNAKLLKEGLKYIRKIIPYRICRVFPNRPCLDYDLGLCSAPCMGKISSEEYLKLIDEIKLYLQGEKSKLVRDLEKEMLFLSKNKKYEKAAKVRDKIKALNRIATESDLSEAHAVLYRLKQRIGLSNLPENIEAFDISNISGKEAVGSMVAFKNAKPYRKNYRRFKIKKTYGYSKKKKDDYRMMKEVLNRRYSRVLKEKQTLPDLIVIDGGKGHLNMAIEKLNALNIKNIDVIAIAKKFDDVYHKKNGKFCKYKLEDEILNVVKRIRDEAHRFANTYHNILRNRLTNVSELDNIPGIGPKRKRELLKYFKNIDNIKKADKKELVKVNKITENVAGKIRVYFK